MLGLLLGVGGVEGLDPVGSEGADQVVDFGRVGDVQYGGATTATPPASWMGEVAWAASGQNLTGVGSPYEAPERPDLVTSPDLEEATRQVLALLLWRGPGTPIAAASGQIDCVLF